MKIGYFITACNEYEELKKLLKSKEIGEDEEKTFE